MTSVDSSAVDQKFLANAMAAFLQIAAVALLIVWCFSIIAPFLMIVLWGLIISIALYPAHVNMTRRLGGREKWSATIFILIGVAIIVVPTWLLADSSINAIQNVSTQLEEGTVDISPPSESVREWPLIGKQTYEIWSDAATNLELVVNKHSDQLKSLGHSALSLAGSTLSTALAFILSVIIGGALLTSAASGYQASRNIAASLAGVDRGHSLTDLAIVTVRSVVKGVLGVAIIQTFLAAIGLVAIGVPAPGIWAGAILVLAIVQLPPILILGPISFWVFSVADPIPASIFLAYSVLVSFSDAVLKPMLLGRGVEVPMLVILLGAIGGAITEGIIGLFIGSVVLAMGYQIFISWMAPDEAQLALEED
jgi:predicted PurR-regulated permease PerM